MKISDVKQRTGRVLAGSLLLSMCVVACNDSEQVAGIDGSGIRSFVEGPIEGFGSIVINGVRYDLDGASIRVNGSIATEAELAIGQIVTVLATVDQDGNASADSVEFEAKLRGQVEAIDIVEGAVFVLGQEIQIGPETQFEPGTGPGELNPGDYIEVSGLSGAEGIIEATYIARADAAEGLRIVGRVDDLDLGAFMFFIGDLVIDYSGAASIEGFPAGGPGEGDEVLVEGKNLDGSGALIVDRLVLVADDPQERAGQQAEVEGLITRFVSPEDFDVSGRPSTTTAQTDYEGGNAADLQLNVKIQIEGSFNNDGVIVATKVEVKDGGVVQH